MSKYEITGGNALYGEYAVQRAKNSALTIMSASILTRGEVTIKNCPKIADVITLSKIMRKLGAIVEWDGDDLNLDVKNIYTTRVNEKLSEQLRASLFLVGPLLARFKTVSFARPGGCAIGSRPIDIHIDGFKRLGAVMGGDDERINFFATRLSGARIRLKYPSVGATENIMSCAALADGETVIENCAREPEVVDLQNFLNACGARIVGAGSGVIRVYGVEKLVGGVTYEPIFDRIECGSLLLTVLSTGGKVTLKGVNAQIISNLLEKISNNTCKVTVYNDRIYINSSSRPCGFGNVVTAPYPLFPTDLHPQLIACACSGEGKTVLTETVFDSRFAYVDQLKKFGANVRVDGSDVSVEGGRLSGAEVFATDLRGGMALVIGALSANGRSVVHGVEHIERGYSNLHKKLGALGAQIKLIH